MNKIGNHIARLERRILGRLQFWLYGYHTHVAPFPGAVRIGSVIASIRYWVWFVVTREWRKS